MRIAHQVGKVRAAEHALMEQLPDGALMQRAAAGLAATSAGMLAHVYGSRVVLLVGSGDNGGDALYAGARLARRGARVEAIPAGSRIHEGGVAALRAAGGRVIRTGEAAWLSAVGSADLILDGLVGIGGSGGLREPHASLARAVADVPATVIAVDLPSGIDASTGQVAGAAVRAAVTVTFGTHKPGLLIDPGASHAGVVELIDIGLGPYLSEPDAVAVQSGDLGLPRPGAESDKYRRGVLGVLAGGETYTGAAVLTVGGAVRGGAGMVRLASAVPVVDLVRQRWPEAVTTALDDVGTATGGSQAGRGEPGGYGDGESGHGHGNGEASGENGGSGSGFGSGEAGGENGGFGSGGSGGGKENGERGGGPGGNGRGEHAEASGRAESGGSLWSNESGGYGRDNGHSEGRRLGRIGRVQAWAAGPGIGTDQEAEARLAEVLASDVPALVDADGLTILARRRELLERSAPTVLTPHAGELARLLGTDRSEIEARRLEHVQRAAAELKVTVLLKGSTTLIAGAGRPVHVNTTGTPRLATAGSGDVLSGLTGALMAQGMDPFDAAVAGAYLHGLAARIAAGDAPIGAHDVIDALPEAFRRLQP